MDRKKRNGDLKYLFVVGGPGGSGATTIAKMLSKYLNLRRVYAGGLFREEVRKLGYENFEDFYSDSNEKLLMDIDEKIDRELINEANQGSVLIDSKIFAAIAEIKNIPCTARIWLDASLHVRGLRHMGKREYRNGIDRIVGYLKIRRDLKKRWKLDSVRYKKLYGVDYSRPEVYNDIVINSSKLNEEETFNLILKELKNGRYIEEK
jgi:predicted cytidylate kinase